MPKIGRPSGYNEDIAQKILQLCSEGKSLKSICNMPGMPAISTVIKWRQENPTFSDLYAGAKQDGCQAIFEELLDIADDGTNDWMESNDPNNPGYRFNGEHYQRSRLRLDTRKWYLSKLAPRLYGDKVIQEITGSNGGPLRSIAQIQLVGPEDCCDNEDGEEE